MSVICPTVTAYDLHEYRTQLERIAEFSDRVHIDLMDGIFAPTISPDIGKLWFDRRVQTDVHIMFQHPDKQIKKILLHNPSLIIVQAEANRESVIRSIAGLKKTKVRVGLSLLPTTDPNDEFVSECLKRVDHVLIFSGKLGYHGGKADLKLLKKIEDIRKIKPLVEIGWDGGINDKNVRELAKGGVDVLNVGGYIQKSTNANEAYSKLTAALG